MKSLLISNIGAKGLNTDLAPWELPPEYLTYGVNFRVSGNRIDSTNSYDPWKTPPAPFNAGHVLAVDVNAGDFWLVPGRSAVWVFDGGTWNDASNPVGYAGLGVDDELNWTSCMLGSIPVINNPQAYPEYWSPQSIGQTMQSLEFSPGNTWQSVNKSFKIIRSHNNFLFALNLLEGGVDLPNAYRWSHPADNNGLPFTWDENDLSSLASLEQILGDAGAIVDGLSLRDSFCIYSERGVNILDFTGGEFVFRSRELSSTYGLLNRNCIEEANGVHYFLGDGDIFRNDGNTIKSIAYNRIKKRLNSQLNPANYNRSFTVNNKAAKEIWFCVPEGSAAYPDTAYIYNYEEDAWSIKLLPSNMAFAAYGAISSAPLTWNSLTGTGSSTNLTWGTQSLTPLNNTVVGVDVITSELIIINPLTSSSTADTSSRIERTDFALEGQAGVSTLTRVYPHMAGSSDVSIQFGSQQFAGAPVVWKPAQTFNPSTDRKLDIRTTGELHAWRIDSVGTGNWSVSGMTIEYSPAGKR